MHDLDAKRQSKRLCPLVSIKSHKAVYLAWQPDTHTVTRHKLQMDLEVLKVDSQIEVPKHGQWQGLVKKQQGCKLNPQK